ncbi:hypothetical protein ACFT5C_05130 [Streptomyces sp. NPDC057116]|uniref:hypothetical protein n=1 Tax=Streptomyces sp. NPDC057116 TaxID=3346023 RepID=UPI003635D15B
MSSDAPVDPAEVPVFTSDEVELAAKVKVLSGAGAKISTAAGDVHTSFGGLRAFYRAPEAEHLFATTKPVQDKALEVGSDLCVIAGALGTYADDIRPLVAALDELRLDAANFRDRIAGDDTWREDGDLIEENLDRRNRIAEVWTQFQAAERACYNTIVALVDGSTPLATDDGSHQPGMYGYDAGTLKQAESLPWGDAVAESTPGWQVWEHAGDFFEGFFVDGVWATVSSLGTLVGVHGWDEAGQAWKGLGMVATGVAISVTPVAGSLYASVPDEELPAWLRDSRTAMKEAGKAFVAWDQWGENPARAGGAVTFNVLSTVFTAGAGGAVSGAGRAGTAAKALSLAGRAGRALDPATYLFKGAAASLSRIGDVMRGLRGMGHVDVSLPPGMVELPTGASLLPDGTLRLPDGAALPPGVVELPRDTVRLPDGTPVPPGSIDFGDGMVRLPAGTPAPPGATPVPEGTLKVTDGTIALPEGTVKHTDAAGNTVYLDPGGNLYDADGTLLQHAKDATPEHPPAAAADTRRVGTPARQPALVTAGATAPDDAPRPGHTPDGTPGDVGRAGDDVRTTDRATPPAPTARAGGDLPGGAGGRMPANSLDNTLSGSGRGGDSGRGTNGGAHDTTGGATADSTVSAGSSTSGGTSVSGRPAAGTGTPGLGDGTGSSSGEQAASRSPEEMKRIRDEHVRLANENPDWRRAHYDSRWHRRNADEYVDGQLLPKLTEGPDGKVVATDELPYADREHYRLKAVALGVDSVKPHVSDELDDLARAHKNYTDLGNAERAFKENPTVENQETLDAARDAMEGQPNNTRVGEKFGEGTARLHAVPETFENAQEIDLMDTGNGARRFDQLYRLDQGRGDFLIVEAKAPDGRLLWRKGVGAESQKMVKQGTVEYVRTILHEMIKRGDPDKSLAEEMLRALRNKEVQYVMVKANKHPGTYAGAELHHFDLYREGR